MNDNLFIKSLDWTRIDANRCPTGIRLALDNIQDYPIQLYEISYPQNLYWIKLKSGDRFAIPGFWVKEVGLKNE